jgi:4-aminobutyrate aminotransferase-like enzyme
MGAWPESTGEALHTGTFFGHPFSAGVGRRTIEAIVSQNLAERSLLLGAEVLEFLKLNLIKHNTEVKDIRGYGLMIGIEFSKSGFAAKLMDELRNIGIIALPSGPTGSVLSITPALNIERDLILSTLDKLVGVVNSIK